MNAIISKWNTNLQKKGYQNTKNRKISPTFGVCVEGISLSDNDNITLYIKNNRQRRICNKSEGEEGELLTHK